MNPATLQELGGGRGQKSVSSPVPIPFPGSGKISPLAAPSPDQFPVVRGLQSDSTPLTEVLEQVRGAQSGRPVLKRKNREILAFLREWMREPDPLGKEWWAEFDREMAEHRRAFQTRATR